MLKRKEKAERRLARNADKSKAPGDAGEPEDESSSSEQSAGGPAGPSASQPSDAASNADG